MADNVATSGTAAVIGGANTVSGINNVVGMIAAAPLPEPTTTPAAASPAPAVETKTETAPAQAAAPAPTLAPAAAAQAAAPVQTAAAPAQAETKPTAPAEDIDAIKGENYALKAGVKPECAADVITLAKSRVKDGTTLEQAITEVVGAYPAFKNVPPPAMTPSVSISNDSAADSAEDAKIDAIMGIKPTKKED